MSIGTVVVWANRHGSTPRAHETATQLALAGKLAQLMGYEFGGEYQLKRSRAGSLYFLPNDTVASLEEAASLGIRSETDLFGGVVPFPFVATKSITHGLLFPDSPAPAGWSSAFGREVADVVLPGLTAFSHEDALEAGTRLLKTGTIRLKETDGIGGLGQTLVSDARQLQTKLEAIDPKLMMRSGLVFEKNLAQVETYSVGQVRIGDLVATYYGDQRLARSHKGKEVYGGSDLIVVRGDFDDLVQLEMPEFMRTAIAQARTYHQAAIKNFRGMFASRCNYDVARGYDEHGTLHAGVLEQSWRMGGASGAELAALSAFASRPDLKVVRASTVETYSDDPVLPPGAVIYFQGNDPDIGPLTKYSHWRPYVNP